MEKKRPVAGYSSAGEASQGDPAGEGARRAPRLMDEVRRCIRVRHYSLRTEQAYVGWITRFIRANHRRHPRELGQREVEAFLSLLAVRGQVAASTQNQALAALLFLYREVLGQKLPWMDNVVRAKRPLKVPVVLSVAEVRALLAAMDGRAWLMGPRLRPNHSFKPTPSARLNLGVRWLWDVGRYSEHCYLLASSHSSLSGVPMWLTRTPYVA